MLSSQQFLVFFLLLCIIFMSTQNKGCVQHAGFVSAQPYRVATRPTTQFKYPYNSPWEFYQSPWLMYKQPWLLSKEDYYRYSVPNYYTKFNRDYYGDMNIIR